MDEYTRYGFGLKRTAELAGLHNQHRIDDESLKKRESLPNGKKTKGRVKIKMEFIDNKLRRYTTFSKRKTGIMKKAYELSTLTGTEVMLLVASETGHVYTFATKKLQPMITSEAGKALIQTCLNSPDEGDNEGGAGEDRMCAAGYEETDLSYAVDKDEDDAELDRDEEQETEEQIEAPSDEDSNEAGDTPTNLSMHSPTREPTSRQPERGEPKPSSSGFNSYRRSDPVDSRSSYQGNSSFVPTTVNAKPTILAPSLPPEILAQLGYTSLLAQTSVSSARAQGASRPVLLLPAPTPRDQRQGAVSNQTQNLQSRFSSLQPRPSFPIFVLPRSESGQSPENLSLNKDER